MKKRLLSLIMAVLLLASALPGTVLAAETDTQQENAAEETEIAAAAAEDTPEALSDPAGNAVITVPENAEVFLGTKGTKHFVPFTEVEPVSMETANGTDVYYFELTDKAAYNFRISGSDYITYGGTFTKQANKDYELMLTEAELKPAGKTKTTTDRSLTANSGFNVADIYLNINPQGYLKLDGAGSSHQIVNLRSWEAVDSTTNNYFIEPDFHYEVLDENGGIGDDSVVTVSGSGLLEAKGEGTAIVLVTYDAMTLDLNGKGAQFYGAIWPENTGVFVVSVGAGDSGITTGMKINEGKNTTKEKLAGDALDAEHDVIYFIGDSGSYTFKPGTAGCSVSVANPTVTNKAAYSGFTGVEGNADGSFTVPLTQGRNIVKLTKDGKAEYQVITAKRVSVTVNGGVAVHPGDALRVEFETLYHPVSKLAKFYNMYAFASYSGMTGVTGTVEYGSTPNQYKFASTAAAQTVDTKRVKGEKYGNLSYESDGLLAVPEDYEGESITLSGGTLHAYYFGEAFGSHRRITYTEGVDNTNPGGSETRDGFLGSLPDIVIPITKAEVESLSVTTLPKKTSYVERTAFDGTGMVLTAHYSDGSDVVVSNYTVSPEKLSVEDSKVVVSFGGKSVDIPVTVTERALKSIKISQKPTKIIYTAGELFDPTGMIVTATYDNNETAEVTDYTYSTKESTSEMKEGITYVTVSYTEKGVTKTMNVTGLKVNAAVGGGNDNTDDITVMFSLYGDARHDSDTDGNVHTMKSDNLTEWISEREITVKRDSKVIDVITRAMSLAGISYENPDGNYISKVKGLGELDNGVNSGWLYSLNGKYPDLGVAEQSVKNGDVIIFHYTDDHRVDNPHTTGGVSGGASGGTAANPGDKAETTLTPEVEANVRGEASAVIGEDAINNTIADAKAGQADVIVVSPEVKGDAYKVSVELPKSGVDNIAKQTNADLKVGTGIADITIPQESLDDLAKQSGSKVTISAEAVRDSDNLKLEIAVDGKSVEKLSGGIAVSVPAKDDGRGNVLVIVNSDGTETIVRKSIADGKTVEALLDGSCTVRVVDNSKHFDDTVNHWSRDAVAFAGSHELFSGTGPNTFEPDTFMSRAMLATVLYRLEDAAANGSNTFPDVAEGTWYTDAVTWAGSAGIVTGTGSGFDPNGNVTREQLAAMLYRYAGTLGMSTGTSGGLSRFIDGGKTSDWAKDAMEWAVGSGLLSGKGSDILDPTGSATRAEVAVIMQRLIGLMVK